MQNVTKDALIRRTAQFLMAGGDNVFSNVYRLILKTEHMKFIQLFDRFNFTKIVVKSNQRRIYKNKLHSLFRKSVEFDYNCFVFISLLKTFMCKDLPRTYSKQNNLGYSPYLGTIHILN